MAIIDSYSESNQSVYFNLGNGAIYRVGQTFVGDGGDLCIARFYLKIGAGSPSGTITATLYATSGGAPTGSALATSLGIDASLLTSSYALYDFHFSSPYTVANGTTYWIGVEFSGDASNYAHVGTDDTSPAHSGTCYYYTTLQRHRNPPGRGHSGHRLRLDHHPGHPRLAPGGRLDGGGCFSM
jgi:hypothetical protein